MVTEIKYDTRYLGQDKNVTDKMKEMLNKTREGNVIDIIKADTGAGKSKLIFDVAKKEKVKVLFVLPNIRTVNNVAKTYGGIAINSTTNIDITKEIRNFSNTKPIICTVDQLSKLREISESILNRYVLVVDEAHYYVKAAMDRTNAIRALDDMLNKGFKNILFITATPEPVYYLLKYKFNTTKFISSHKKQYYIKYYNYTKGRIDEIATVIKDIISRGKKAIVYNNDSKIDNEMLTKINGVYSISSDSRNCEIIKSLEEKELIPDYVSVLVTTDIITNGLNIKNKDIDEVVIVGTKDKTTIAQFTARLRHPDNITLHHLEYVYSLPEPKYLKESDFFLTTAQAYVEEAKEYKLLIDRGNIDYNYLSKTSKELEMLDLIEAKGEKENSRVELNFWKIASKTWEYKVSCVPASEKYEYLVGIEEGKQDDEYIWEIENNGELKEQRKEEREKRREEEEAAKIKAIDIVEKYVDIIMYKKDFGYVVMKENLTVEEEKAVRSLARKYEKYNLDIKTLSRLERDEKFRRSVMFTVLRNNKKDLIKGSEIYTIISRITETRMEKGRKIPQSLFRDLSPRQTTLMKEALKHLIEKDEEGRYLGKKKNEFYTKLTQKEKAEVKRMFLKGGFKLD
jgi:hypothetical protein